MEAPRGAREPTGTNGPTLTNTLSTTNKRLKSRKGVDRHHRVARRHYADHNQHKPPPGDNRILVEPLVVVIAAGKRPAPIPNLEAKPASADGTAPGRVWESRTPPQHTLRVGPWNTNTVPRPHPNFYTHNTHTTHAPTTRTQHNFHAKTHTNNPRDNLKRFGYLACSSVPTFHWLSACVSTSRNRHSQLFHL